MWVQVPPPAPRARGSGIREVSLNRNEIEEVLAHLSPEEVPEILKVIGILERNGGATPEEAEEYRRRVRAWAVYYGLQDPES